MLYSLSADERNYELPIVCKFNYETTLDLSCSFFRLQYHFNINLVYSGYIILSITSEAYNIFILVFTIYRSFHHMASDGYNFASVSLLGDVFMMAIGHTGRQTTNYLTNYQFLGMFSILMILMVSLDQTRISFSLIAVSFCVTPGVLLYYRPWKPCNIINKSLSLR